MSFNPDPSKQAVEVYFSKKRNLPEPPFINFNNSPLTYPITIENYQKHLGLVLDQKLTFDQHIDGKILKANRGIGLLHKLRRYLPRHVLITIYKAYVRPHLDYGDIIYDIPGNLTFEEKLEKIQYNACLAITGCFRGTSRERLYLELGLESLAGRCFIRRLIFFYKIVKGIAPRYLSNYLPHQTRLGGLRTRPPFESMNARTNRFRSSLFPFVF